MNPKRKFEHLQRLRWGRTQEEVARILGVDVRTVGRWERGETPPRNIPGERILQHLNHAPLSGDFTFADLFAGIGGTRVGFQKAGGRCVFTSEWDTFARRTYDANFPHSADHVFKGDITTVDEADVPDHDVLLAGFPCQPFSLAGVSKKKSLGRPHGFHDATQGTLFFDIARIIEAKRPTAFLLENVRNLVGHDRGRTFKTIRDTLDAELDYEIVWDIVSARHWVPQKRERVLIVGFDRKRTGGTPAFDFKDVVRPERTCRLGEILHPEDGTEAPEEPYTVGKLAEVNRKYRLSRDLWTYLKGYAKKHELAGNGFGFGLVGPEDVARTLSARYYKDGSEILVDRGQRCTPRRLTPRECARLLGFPDDFVIPPGEIQDGRIHGRVSDTQAYKQFGNSIVVPMVEAVAAAMRPGVLRYSPLTPGRTRRQAPRVALQAAKAA